MSLAGRTGRRRAPWFDDERAASAEELGREVRALKLADDVGRTASWQASSGMVVEPLDPQGMEQRLPDLLAAAGFFRRAEASNVEVGARARLPARVRSFREAGAWKRAPAVVGGASARWSCGDVEDLDRERLPAARSTVSADAGASASTLGVLCPAVVTWPPRVGAAPSPGGRESSTVNQRTVLSAVRRERSRSCRPGPPRSDSGDPATRSLANSGHRLATRHNPGTRPGLATPPRNQNRPAAVNREASPSARADGSGSPVGVRTRTPAPQGRVSSGTMSGVRARVENGRLIVDEPTSLPEGTVIDLVFDDEGDDLDSAERQARDAALLRAWEQAQRGEGKSAQSVLEELRGR